VGASLSALACNEDAQPTDAPMNAVCSGDYSDLPASGVSLEHDLMPIFEASCTFSSCHDRSARKAGLVLGDPKATDPGDAALLKEVRDSLLAPSTTVKSPIVPRVTPGDPTKSFVLDKMTGTQNERGYAQCQNQGPSGSPPNGCGDPMPFGDPNYCSESPMKVESIAAWIRDGAPQN
jgi:hypothetical protein